MDAELAVGWRARESNRERDTLRVCAWNNTDTCWLQVFLNCDTDGNGLIGYQDFLDGESEDAITQ